MIGFVGTGSGSVLNLKKNIDHEVCSARLSGFGGVGVNVRASGHALTVRLDVSTDLRSTVSMSAAESGSVGIGVIGCGRIGVVHASAISSLMGADLVMVTDPFESAGKKVEESFGVEWTPDWTKLVNDPRIKGVVIGSPTPYHAEQIIACAEAGKDVFCEKPISNDLKVIDECIAAVEKSGIKLMVGFQRRFDSNFLTIKSKIEAGDIGQVRMFQIISRDPAPPPKEYLEKSGGIFLDMASHDFDMARFVTSSEIDEVYVCGAAFDPEAQGANDLDSVITTLKMKNGTFGTIQNSRRCALGYDQRIEVFGSDGILTGNNKAPDTVILSNSSGVSAGLPYSFFMDRYAEAYSGAMAAFVDMIRKGTPPPVSYIDGRMSIVVARAANLSAKEGRPVKLSEVE
eukprot:CAMPEP_0182444272 /NCGR_PEP_ID=MMETSP1172-20130603/2774_1 /TAXON_ID=708627 /ORGANISM="Timspurckia oligopyrenoides, Strain CCMP3278" /LENGTH=399 /DNA_ID=CAMNT_0024639795 /DNA_START=36 /DNA_END=1235 /DNA_ORIENTATION=-